MLRCGHEDDGDVGLVADDLVVHDLVDIAEELTRLLLLDIIARLPAVIGRQVVLEAIVVKRRDLSVELREGLGEVVLDVFRELLEVHALVVAVEYGEEIRVEEQQLET